MGIFEEMASGAEVVGEVDPNDPMTRAKRCAYIVLRAHRKSVRKLGSDKLRRFLAVEAACRQVGLGTIKPAVITVDDWQWMEGLLIESETLRYDPGPEGMEKIRQKYGQAGDA